MKWLDSIDLERAKVYNNEKKTSSVFNIRVKEVHSTRVNKIHMGLPECHHLFLHKSRGTVSLSNTSDNFLQMNLI